MSVKALRHYHRIGILVPVVVDRHTGYRRYDAEQIGRAQVIRRLRDLQMPLEEIAAVLDAPTLAARNERISAHLDELERSLEQTVSAVATLRELLDGEGKKDEPITYRSVPATPAAAITETMALHGASVWSKGRSGSCSPPLPPRV
jgi:DNA-binding transcriptional MerR regulator